MDNINRDQINEVLDQVSGRLGADSGKLKDAVNNDSLDKFLGNLKPADAKKLQSVLNDKAETERLLNSPQARMLLKRLLK